MDKTIIAVIQRYGKISSLNLLKEIVTKESLCTQSTLYLHIKKLLDKGLIEKKREGKIVYYAIPSIEVKEIKPSKEIHKHYDDYDSYDNYDRS